MQTIEETARQVFAARADLYTTSAPHTDAQALARVLALAAPHSDWTVLDVATGTGNTSFAFAPHAASVVGLDLTPEMLAEAEKLRAARGLTNVTFCEGDVHALPWYVLLAARR